ncbi:acyltransferase family protein [Gryllotalpicola ginsengisoli]|uniref:acyltransferase family protein n=1 Tax=Gryllotalpicola ginsengisoli TaxID=444608 RepID=UPI0003B5F72E|nr:acyltransferase [Gryllotalpicola ginsengisoli]
MNDTRSTGSARLRALDGLRGCLALIVVLSHSMTTVDPPSTFAQNPLLWIVTYTPLHLAWSGQSAVYVFFVLSGFVLVWPERDRPTRNWLAWYARRLTRLYFPIWAAMVFSYLLYLTVPRPVTSGTSAWLALHSGHYTPLDLLHDAILLGGVSPILNTAFWSLQWEVAFSLLLPLLALVALRVRRRATALALAVVCVAASAAGQIGAVDAVLSHFDLSLALTYLPMFGIGALMAASADDIERAVGWLSRAPLAVGALWASALAGMVWHDLREPQLSTAPAVVAAALLVALFAFSASGQRIGMWRPIGWLGERSFSIYLVHGPIVVSLAYHLAHAVLPWAMLVTALPLAIVAGHFFYRFVEHPLHGFSRRIGAAVASLRVPEPSPERDRLAPPTPTES